MIHGLEGLTYTAKLAEVGLDTLEKRRLRNDMVEVYKLLANQDNIGSSFFEYDENIMNLRYHNRKLKGKPFKTEIRRNAFSQRIVNTWNSLPKNVVNSLTLDSFKNHLTKNLRNLE